MDPRQRTLLFALVGIALGVLATIGLVVIAMRGAAPSAEPIAQPMVQPTVQPTEAREERPDAGVAIDDPKEEDPLAERAVPVAPERNAPGPLVVEHLGVKRVACRAACAIEEQCGFRDRASCIRASCEGEVRKANRSDFAFAKTDSCDKVALTPCEEACSRRGECTGDHRGDKACTAACVTLARQRPRASYREHRCVLESACAELALCGGDGPAPEAAPTP